MKEVDLSIIILSWNTKNLLQRCVESIISDLGLAVRNRRLEKKEKRLNDKPIADRRSLTTELIIVDNGSTDGSKEYINGLTKLQTNGLEIKAILNEKNLGFSKGNNIGIRKARGEHIMLLNSDTMVKEDAIGRLLEFLDRSDTCQVAVSPLLLLPEGKPQTDYYMRFPNLWQIFLYHNPVLRPLVMKIPFLGLLIAKKNCSSPFAVDQLPGAALMAHREVWEKVGLLDEDYHFLFEDVDWCWRAKKLGIKLMVVPQAKIVHFGGASWKQRLKKNSSQFYYQFFSSMLLFVRKNYSKQRAIIFKWAIIINFFMTLKPLLAWQFLKRNGRQENYLLQ